MPNHCMNKISMVFQEKHCAKQFKDDLESLGDDKDNLCQLIFAYDDTTKQITLSDGSVKTLEGDFCPILKYWGTQWGTYHLSIDTDTDDKDSDGYVLEYFYDSAWCAVSEKVLLGLIAKYNLVSIVNHYHEPVMGIAGTQYSCGNNQICHTDNCLYHSIYVKNVGYASFKALVKQCYVDKPANTANLNTKQLTALFKKFSQYEYMYLSFEQRAYQALINEKQQPMLSTFIANNLV